MEESLGPQAHPESQSLTDHQVDGLLLSSKKIRYRNRKACYPCNKRKIKCDRDEQPNGQPCSNCRKRPHPELCSYEDSNPRSSGGSTRSTAHTSQPATPNQHGSQQAGRHLQGQPLLSGIHAASAAYGADTPYSQSHDSATTYSPYYGDNGASHPTTPYSAKASASPFAGQGLALQVSHQAARYDVNLPARAAPPVSTQPAPSTTYLPQHPTNLRDEINSLLPPQKHILPHFEVYRTFCAPINPIILELDDFEANVCNHVVGLANGQLLHSIISSGGRSQEVILTQLAQLLATIASGIQYSDVPHAERNRLLQEYTRNSFRCLRLANFLLRPSFVSIQTILLLATVLQNGLLPEPAWALLNTTKALAKSLGLDTSRLPGVNGYSDMHLGLELWSIGAWQETYLATCFGRQPVGLGVVNEPLKTSTLENLDYKQSLRALSEIISGTYHPGPEVNSLENAILTVANLDQRTLPRLQSQDHCRSIQNRLEYFAFRIQSGFVAISLFLRQMNSHKVLAQQQKRSIESCRASCLRTLRAFLDMQTFTAVPLRTWTFLHNALTSALLLGIFGENNDGDARMLQTSLIDILMRSEEEEGTAAKGFRRCFGRAVEDLKKMIAGTYKLGQGRTRDAEVDTEMSDGVPTTTTGDSTDGAVPNLANIWHTYFAELPSADSDPAIELVQQNAWGL